MQLQAAQDESPNFRSTALQGDHKIRVTSQKCFTTLQLWLAYLTNPVSSTMQLHHQYSVNFEPNTPTAVY
ncbi:MAG: hypothetical protein CMP47_13915 [Rickettsiales bacterium]|nr:hypothetical protein [Rickettsiales bacterium]